MGTLFSFLMGAVGPVVIQALVTLGFTAVTVTGATVAMNALVNQAQTSWAALPAGVLALCSLAGIHTCIGLVFGAFLARLTTWAAVGASKLLIKSA